MVYVDGDGGQLPQPKYGLQATLVGDILSVTGGHPLNPYLGASGNNNNNNNNNNKNTCIVDWCELSQSF